jgi:hypothetical protein
VVRNIAVQFGRAYADLMQPTISYDWLLTNGFIVDGTHLNSAGGLLCANIMWDDLGFFALGLDRRVHLEQVGSQWQISYNVSTAAVYRLEFSTNLSEWQPLFTNATGQGLFSTNLTANAPCGFYRLGLSPR